MSDVYPCIIKGRYALRLYWESGHDKQDSFIVNEMGELANAETDQSWAADPLLLHHVVHADEAASFDMKQFWGAVRSLNPAMPSDRRTCSILLDGLNLLIDLANTLLYPVDFFPRQNKILAVVYQKLFAGNNLPVVTPVRKSYHPAWTTQEIRYFRFLVHRAWRHLRMRSPALAML